MSIIIQTSELVIGDLYVTYSTLGRDRAGEAVVRVVTGRRTLRTGHDFTILTTSSLDGLRHGEISLRRELPVERLDHVSHDAILERLAYPSNGEQMLIVFHDGRFYA